MAKAKEVMPDAELGEGAESPADVNSANLDEDGEQDDAGEEIDSSPPETPPVEPESPPDDFKASDEAEQEPALETDADDPTPRIIKLEMLPLPSSEHVSVTVTFAGRQGHATKRKIFSGSVSCARLAEALINVDTW